MTPRTIAHNTTLIVGLGLALFLTLFAVTAPASATDDPHGRYGYDGACTLYVGASGLQTSYSLFRETSGWVGGWVAPGEPKRYFTVADGEAFLLEITVVKPRDGGTEHHRIIEGTGKCPDTTTTGPTLPPDTTQATSSSTTTPTLPPDSTTTTSPTPSTTTSATTTPPVVTTTVPSTSSTLPPDCPPGTDTNCLPPNTTTTTLLEQPPVVDDCGPFAPPPCPPENDIVWPPRGFTPPTTTLAPGWIDTELVDRDGAPVLLWDGEESG